jgi:hypothetical protein
LKEDVSLTRICNLVSRWEQIKDKLPKILVAYGKLWTFHNPCDPWGSKESLSWDDFEKMIVQAELPKKKEPGREDGADQSSVRRSS